MSKRRAGRRAVPRTPSLTLLALRGELTAHLADTLPDEEVTAVVQRLVALVREAEQDAGLTDLASWTRTHVEVLLGTATRDERAAALALLFGFLSETGRWSGDGELLADVLAAPGRALSAQLRAVAVAHHDADREAAAVDESPVVEPTVGFLRWFGPGPRELTATGALRLRDVHDAIEQLDLPPQVRRVTSMWDHPDLVESWAHCLDTGLLVVAGSRVLLTADGAALRDGDPVAGRELLRCAIAAEVSDPQHGYFPDGAPLAQVAEMALAALEGDGPHLPSETGDLDLQASLLLAGLGRPDPDEESRVVSALFFSTLLGSGGFVAVGGRLALVPGLESLVLTTVADLLDGAPFAPRATQLGRALARGDADEAALAGPSTLRLRVHLADDQDPGRSLDVPGDSTVADLYPRLLETIGASAGARHEFIGIDPVRRRTTWAPGRAAGAEDEDRVQLVDALSGVAVLGCLLDGDGDRLSRVELVAVRP